MTDDLIDVVTWSSIARVDHATTRTMQGSSFTRGSSLAALAETDAAAPRIQLVEIQGSGSHSKFCVPVGGANVFSVPPKSPGLAQAYLQECCRRVPALPWVDLVVVLDGMRPICFGPPTGWDLGVAARVQRSQLETGILRVFRPGCMIDSKMLASAAAHGRPGGSSSNAPAAALSEGVGPSSSSAAVRGSAADRDPLLRGRSGSLAKILARSLKVGVSSDPGGCSHMEDASLVHAPPGSDFAFIGVFDGHGGEKAAQFCKEHLHLNVMASSSFRSGDPRAALRDGFRKTESDLIFEQRTRSKSASDEVAVGGSGDADRRGSGGGDGGGGGGAGCCGSTVLLMLLQLESLHVAWLGDCRAVLCRGGEAIAITQDHCLEDESERARALAEGGTVVGNRLGGFLEVARALGDFDHTLGGKPAGLSAQPDVRTQPLQPEDEFVVLGSDGLWGVIGPDDAVRLARAELQAYEGDAAMASEKLVEVAQKRHADDNITALVAVLNFSAAAKAEAPRERPRLRLMPRTAAVPHPGPDERTSNGSTASASSVMTASSILHDRSERPSQASERMSGTSERLSGTRED